MLILGTIIFVFFILLIFVSRKHSPVPYFPTNKKDIPLIIKALDLKNNKAVVDLGAGDGIVIFEAAKYAYDNSLKNKFYAVEINPILVLIMNLKRLFHKNRKNIYILRDDFTKMSLKRFKNAVFYLYLSPKYLQIVYKKIKKEAPNSKILSYFYKYKYLSKFKKINGENNLYKAVA
ncbi:MAG: rRNA adenine N-6-methyltransferase family protein [Patescibacteria group bacterium]